MNQKHISCAIIVFFIAVLIQVTLYVQANRTKVQQEATAAEQQENDAAMQVGKERSQLSELKRQSADIIKFLRVWQPEFDIVGTTQSAEVSFDMKVRESGLLNLTKSFQAVAVKDNPSIPSVLHAKLVFEDDYIKLLNWLGKMEATLPTVRVGQIHIKKGSRPTDIWMEISLEQPLIAK
jgi:hypothetical protein